MSPLALRRGRVVSVEVAGGPLTELTVAVAGERRPALAVGELVGEVAEGDEVVVNVAALELGLGSGGFDLVHVNLTRGLEAPAGTGAAMALPYTSLQHAVDPVEVRAGPADAEAAAANGAALGRPVAVLALHGQLDAVAWAAHRVAPGARVGYVQTGGGALPGALPRTARVLLERGLLVGHLAAAPAFGGRDGDAVTVAGALHAGLTALGWEGAIVGPGPGIVGSASRLGHGGLAALESAHAALALGARTLLVPRLSSGDPRPRHRGLSHHSAAVLELLLRPVEVAVPAEPGLAPELEQGGAPVGRHRVRPVATDLAGYRDAGISPRTMGRSIGEDELFFRAALAGGGLLGEEIAGVRARGSG